jgi:acid phosphatase type 7
MNVLGKLNKTRLILAGLVLIAVIDGLLFYQYKDFLESPPSSEVSAPAEREAYGEELPEPPEAPRQAILVGAGDIADCSRTADEATAKLLDNIEGTVFTTGDNAYDSGTDTEFENCYEPTWGRHKARTYPTPGNHDYRTAGASGYFNYFGAAAGEPGAGYYSYDLGEWHVVALNSRCDEVGGCEADSPMLRWLRKDLAENAKSCTVAYFHDPLFSSGRLGNNTKMLPAWEALYAANADVVLSGSDHLYERFAAQSPAGVADATRGIRQFVVGTGGAALHSIKETKPNSVVQNTDAHGVLKLTLHSTSYEWEFVPVTGKTFKDSGSDSCH